MIRIQKKNIITDWLTGVNRWIFIILLISAMVNGIFGFVYFSKPAQTLEDFKNSYPYLDPSRNFISQDHFINNLQPIRDEFNDLAAKEKENGNEINLYMEFLNTGANISINPNSRYVPASLNKIPTAIAVTKAIQDGEWNLNDQLVLLPDDINEDYGTLWQEKIGATFTIEFLLKKTLSESDNTAFAILYRNTEIIKHDDVLEELGLREIFGSEGLISAKEYSRLMRSLYTSSYLNREHSQLLLQWLSEASFKEFLSQGIPDEITFAHKFGIREEERVYADSGIVYVSNRPYLMTVIIHPTREGNTYEEDRAEAERIMKEISEKAFDYISNY